MDENLFLAPESEGSHFLVMNFALLLPLFEEYHFLIPLCSLRFHYHYSFQNPLQMRLLLQLAALPLHLLTNQKD
ncbi:MAG: hypothetical protein SP1CHLAM42_03590 [Chlamydiales bacterium]|nr:hypothetical protein [Chlamydiales bacterium]